MSGIPTSGAGDVKLDGDPNAFTGTNTFDVNRPTSTLGGTPSTTDFITKQDGDALYQGAGNVAILNGTNPFTGTNTFVNRPAVPSTPAATAGTLDFITKRDGNSLYVTTDTTQDITGEKTFKDSVELDGAVNSNVALLTQDGLSGNSFLQKAPLVGNLIVQGVSPSTQPSTPIGASLFFQAGATSLIQTDGKVVCGTAPTAGDDLTNKTYVDAAIAAGGGEWFSGYNCAGSCYGFVNNRNVSFVNMNSSPNVNFFDNGCGTGQTQGANFSVDATTAGTWVIGFTGLNVFFNNTAVFYLYDRGSILGYLYNQQTFSNGFQNVNGIWTLNLTAGQQLCIRKSGAGSSNIQHESTGFWGIRLG